MIKKALDDNDMTDFGVCPVCGQKYDPEEIDQIEIVGIHNRDYNMSRVQFKCNVCDVEWYSYVKQEGIDVIEDENEELDDDYFDDDEDIDY